MATDILVVATWADVGANVADSTVNGFAFHSGDPVACQNAVKDFFHVGASGLGAIGFYINNTRSRAPLAFGVTSYDISGHLDGSPHGSPISASFITPPASVNHNALPDQVACVVRYRADFTGMLERGPIATRPTPERSIDDGAPVTHQAKTRPRATRRGRLFLGPLSLDAFDAAGDVAPGFATVISAAGARLIALNIGWSVWSRSTASMNPIIAGGVDSTFGVVRRRRDKVTEFISPFSATSFS